MSAVLSVMVVLAGLLGCAGTEKVVDDTGELAGDPCLSGDAPTLVIGVGEEGYEPLEPGSEVPLIFGPQGGYHVVLALAGQYLDPEPVWTVTMTGTIGGELWGQTVPYAQPRCDAAAGLLVAWNLLLIWEEVEDPDPYPLDGETLDVAVSALDMSGAVVEAETSLVLRYE